MLKLFGQFTERKDVYARSVGTKSFAEIVSPKAFPAAGDCETFLSEGVKSIKVSSFGVKDSEAYLACCLVFRFSGEALSPTDWTLFHGWTKQCVEGCSWNSVRVKVKAVGVVPSQIPIIYKGGRFIVQVVIEDRRTFIDGWKGLGPDVFVRVSAHNSGSTDSGRNVDVTESGIDEASRRRDRTEIDRSASQLTKAMLSKPEEQGLETPEQECTDLELEEGELGQGEKDDQLIFSFGKFLSLPEEVILGRDDETDMEAATRELEPLGLDALFCEGQSLVVCGGSPTGPPKHAEALSSEGAEMGSRDNLFGPSGAEECFFKELSVGPNGDSCRIGLRIGGTSSTVAHQEELFFPELGRKRDTNSDSLSDSGSDEPPDVRDNGDGVGTKAADAPFETTSREETDENEDSMVLNISLLLAEEMGLKIDGSRSDADKMVIQVRKEVLAKRKSAALSSHSDVFFLCGSRNVDWSAKDSVGASGGLLTVWDKSKFEATAQWVGSFTTVVVLDSIVDGFRWCLVNCYGPCDRILKPAFIEELKAIAQWWLMPICVMGDFNLVRSLQEVSGVERSRVEMDLLNDLIADFEWVDLPLCGGKFTWTNFHGIPSMSRLDRVLISEEWESNFPDYKVNVLPRVCSDHNPLLLSAGTEEFFKRPWKFELMWMEHPEFTTFLHSVWGDRVVGSGGMFLLPLRLKLVKKKFKLWNKKVFKCNETEIAKRLSTIADLDREEESDVWSEDLRIQR
ncbi:hypothetical protein LINGRAHAP2_LOCUS11012 [Linum grandiflorum]